MPLQIPAVACAVDFSAFSQMVVAQGVALARRAGARLYLIHAVHHPQDDLHPMTLFERGGGLKTLGADAEARLAAMVPPDMADTQAVVRFGEPVEQIAAFTRDLTRCLVVSASHGVSGFRRLFIGTVVERLTRALPHPMLVVKPGPAKAEAHTGAPPAPDGGFRCAVIGCDSQGNWRRAKPLLALLQPAARAAVHLVHALEAPPAAAGAAPPVSYDQAQSASRQRLDADLHRQARTWLPDAGALTVESVPGMPQEVVLQAARERGADLVVVGVRHSGRVGRWIAGSTTEALLRRAACAVLTLPEPDRSARRSGGSR